MGFMFNLVTPIINFSIISVKKKKEKVSFRGHNVLDDVDRSGG